MARDFQDQARGMACAMIIEGKRAELIIQWDQGEISMEHATQGSQF